MGCVSGRDLAEATERRPGAPPPQPGQQRPGPGTPAPALQIHEGFSSSYAIAHLLNNATKPRRRSIVKTTKRGRGFRSHAAYPSSQQGGKRG